MFLPFALVHRASKTLVIYPYLHLSLMQQNETRKHSEEAHYLSHDLLVALGLASSNDTPDHPRSPASQVEQQPTSASSMAYSDYSSSFAAPEVFEEEGKPYDNALSRFSTGSDDCVTSSGPQTKRQQSSTPQHEGKKVKKLFIRLGHTIAPNQDTGSVSRSSPDYVRPGGRGGRSARKDQSSPRNVLHYSTELVSTSSGSVSEHSLPPAHSTSSSELRRIRPGGRAARVDRDKHSSYSNDASSTSSASVSDRSVQLADRPGRIRASG